jgi:hypothetical protein
MILKNNVSELYFLLFLPSVASSAIIPNRTIVLKGIQKLSNALFEQRLPDVMNTFIDFTENLDCDKGYGLAM